MTRRSSRKAALAGGIGTLIEYYDFTVYIYVTSVIAPQFFPNTDPAVSVLSGLAVFASGYLVRPLGGLVFGRIGDRYGRKPALVTTVVAMGVLSVLVGLLPTYAQIGLAAPVLLVALRLLQGFAAGGEYGGSMTYISESAPFGRRGFFAAFTPMGSNLGFAASAGAVGLVTALTTTEQMASWGWRVPFLLCLPLTVLSLVARLRLEDTPEFRAAGRRTLERTPIREVLTAHRKGVLQVVGLGIAMNGTAYIGSTYLNSYLITTVGMPKTTVYWLIAGSLFLLVCLLPFAGMLVDRFGRKPVFGAGVIAHVVLTYPLFLVMDSGAAYAVVGLAFVVYILMSALIQAPAVTMYTEFFPSRVRYTGSTLGFNVATIAAGGFAPYIAAQLTYATGDPLSPAWFVIGVALVGLVTLTTVRLPAPSARAGDVPAQAA